MIKKDSLHDKEFQPPRCLLSTALYHTQTTFKMVITFRKLITAMFYKFITQYNTYLNIWEKLLRALSSLLIHDQHQSVMIKNILSRVYRLLEQKESGETWRNNRSFQPTLWLSSAVEVRLTKVLAGATRGERGRMGEAEWAARLSGLKYISQYQHPVTSFGFPHPSFFPPSGTC